MGWENSGSFRWQMAWDISPHLNNPKSGLLPNGFTCRRLNIWEIGYMHE